ncbi:hypothetical protein UY3_08055 [Chelonia mydas]|uniref:Uncharacterized protein n=1 Tax=Chelonia mydas TaxID=8469 RepID=M7BGP7_CHEMY|nr:hypothetical protein UY3_08055 [Chelonia mydas]
MDGTALLGPVLGGTKNYTNLVPMVTSVKDLKFVQNICEIIPCEYELKYWESQIVTLFLNDDLRFQCKARLSTGVNQCFR